MWDMWSSIVLPSCEICSKHKTLLLLAMDLCTIRWSVGRIRAHFSSVADQICRAGMHMLLHVRYGLTSHLPCKALHMKAPMVAMS